MIGTVAAIAAGAATDVTCAGGGSTAFPYSLNIYPFSNPAASCVAYSTTALVQPAPTGSQGFSLGPCVPLTIGGNSWSVKLLGVSLSKNYIFFVYSSTNCADNTFKASIGRSVAAVSTTKPQNPNREPQTANTQPQSPIPNPPTINPNPPTPNPKLQTPNPKPQTPNHAMQVSQRRLRPEPRYPLCVPRSNHRNNSLLRSHCNNHCPLTHVIPVAHTSHCRFRFPAKPPPPPLHARASARRRA